MPIRFRCPKCGKSFRASSKTRGQMGRCKSCGESIAVPDTPGDSLPPADGPAKPAPVLDEKPIVLPKPAAEILSLGDGNPAPQKSALPATPVSTRFDSPKVPHATTGASQKNRARIVGVVLALLLVGSVAVWFSTRGGKGGGPSGSGPNNGGNGESGPVGSIAIFEVLESNADTFPQRLAFVTTVPTQPPFALDEDGFRLLDDVADATAAAKLSKHSLTLDSTSIPLSRCKVLVAHTTSYGGVGRTGLRERYYGFGTTPASLAITGFKTIDRYEYDPGKEDDPFVMSVRQLRVLPSGEGKLELSLGDKDEARITYGGKVHSLKPGESVVLSKTTRPISVVELPTIAEPIEKGKGGPVEILPRKDHGAITFSTTLTVIYRGQFAPVNNRR